MRHVISTHTLSFSIALLYRSFPSKKKSRKRGAKKKLLYLFHLRQIQEFFVVHSNHRRSSSTTICGTRDMISSKAEDKGCCLGVNRSPVFFVHMEPMCCLSAKWLCSPLPDGSNTQSLCDFIRPDKTWNFCPRRAESYASCILILFSMSKSIDDHSHVLRELHLKHFLMLSER